jgi:hypothetical protein
MEEHIGSHAFRLMTGRVVLVLAVVIGLIAIVLLAVPLLLNTERVKRGLLDEFEQRTGHRVETEDLRLTIFPRPRLDLHDVKIFDGQSEKALLAADHVNIALQVAALLEGRAAVSYVVLDRPRMTLRHHSFEQWTIGERTPETGREESGRPLSLLTVVRNVLIVDGAVTIVDQSRSGQREPVQLTSLQVTMAEQIPGRRTRVQLSGEMAQKSAGSAWLNVDGSLVLLNGTQAGEPREEAGPLQAEGTIRLHNLDVRHIAGWFDLPRGPAQFVPPAQFVGHLRLVPRPDGYDLILTDWRAEISELLVRGAITVTGLGTALPHMSATVSASAVGLEDLYGKVPQEWLPVEIRNKLVEHAVDGFVTLRDTYVTGPLTNDGRLAVSGTVELRDGRFLPGEAHPAVRDVSATVLYDLKQIRVARLRGNYGPVHVSDGTAVITDWKGEPLVDLRISAEADAENTIAFLNNVDRFPRIGMSLREFENVSGTVEATAHVSGQPGKGDLDLVEASVAIRNLGFLHRTLALPFREFQARVNIFPTEMQLEHLEGHAGFARVEGAGTVTLSGTPSFKDVALRFTADGKDLARWLHHAGAEKFRPSVNGYMLLSAAVTGDVRMPRFHGRLTLDGADFKIPHVLSKVRGAPAGIRFEGQLLQDLVLSVKRCEVIFPPVRLTGAGRIHLADDWEFRARIQSDTLLLDKLPRGVRLGPLSAGVIKAGLRMEGRATDRASWVTTGRLHFDEGVLEEQFKEPVENFSMRLRFDGKNIEIRRVAFTIGDSDIRLSGSIAGWLETPRAKLVVESSQMNAASLQLMSSQGSSSPSDAFPVLRSWWADGSVEATVLIDYAYYERTLLSGLSCRVRFERGTLTIDRISADTDEGHLGGRFAITVPNQGPRVVRSAFRVSGVPAERLSSLLYEEPRISGWMAASGRFQGEIGRSRVLYASLNSKRPISIIVENGHLYYAPAISKVLAIMNLPALLKGRIDLTKDGMPLDHLKLVFGVEDGVVHITEFLLDSPILKISATGRYDFVEDNFDAVLVASPLGQYSDLLKSVPLFGKLFAGERQGFDTAIFEIKGPAKDPKVVYLPAESLMAGAKGTAKLALDLLVNAITLPAKAFSMAEDEPVDDDEVQEARKGT